MAAPAGLAAVITMVLAMGVQQMARRGAIMRKLPAGDFRAEGGNVVSTNPKTEIDRMLRAGAGGPWRLRR